MSIFFFSLLGISQNQYSFFVAGHTYGTPGTDSLGLYYPFKQKFSYLQNRTDIKFGVLTGDIVKSSDETHWNVVDSDIVELGITTYFAFGNHDMANRALVESRYGDPYYYYKYNNDLFIILDPNIDEWNISGEQLTFLQNTLDSNAETSNNIFVMMHQLLWWADDNIFKDIKLNSEQGRADTINFWTEVEPLFHTLSNNVVMCAGDIGAGAWSSDVMYYNYDNITFIASGMGEGIGDNFIVINVDSNIISYDLISLNTPDISDMGNLEDYEVVGINDIDKYTNIKIFPNPSKDFINISSKTDFVSISISDISGNYVLNKKVNKNDDIIDIAHLQSGIYFIKIYFNNNTYITRKLVKQ